MIMNSVWQNRKSVPLACGLLVVTLQLGGCATNNKPISEGGEGGAVTRPTHCKIEEKLGICIEGVRRSAAGYMLDLRYKVVDSGKAAPLLDRKVHPYLLEQASGAKLFVPSSAKIGPLRQTTGKPVSGQTFFALFANPGRYVGAGQKLTLVVGDQRVENLTVLE